MFTNKGNNNSTSNRPETTSMPTLPDPMTQRRTTTGRTGIASIIANGVKITGTIEADGAELVTRYTELAAKLQALIASLDGEP